LIYVNIGGAKISFLPTFRAFWHKTTPLFRISLFCRRQTFGLSLFTFASVLWHCVGNHLGFQPFSRNIGLSYLRFACADLSE